MTTENLILNRLRDRIGIDAAQVGEAALRRDIRRAVAACPDQEDLLDPAGQAWKSLLASVLIPETWFFRNPESFDAFTVWARDVWLPAHDFLRILSLPCATGEEPYSIAASLLEAGVDPARFEVVAGDVGAGFLETAARAVYGRNSFRSGFSEERFGRFFERTSDGRRRVQDEVRSRVSFRQINLISDEIPRADVVFCRNALIYFDESGQRKALEQIGSALSEDGLLFLGPVEPPLALRNGFVSAAFPMAFVCRKAGRPETSAQTPRRAVRTAGRVPRPVKQIPRKPALKRPLFMPVSAAPVPSADNLESVRELADCGRVADAAEMLDRLAASGESSAELYCLCGVVYEALGQGTLAEPFYRKALFLEPDHTESWIHLGLLLELDGRADAARPRRQRAPRQLVV